MMQGANAARDLSSLIRDFAITLPKEFPKLYSRDPAKFKRRVLRLFSRAIKLGRGRHCKKEVTLAMEMRAQGKPWRQIYLSAIPNYVRLSPIARSLKQRQLRDSVRSRRSKNARSQRVGGIIGAAFSTPINSTRIIPGLSSDHEETHSQAGRGSEGACGSFHARCPR